MVDAFIILLLVAQTAMIFPALNYSPVRWFRSLTSIEKFTFVLAIFTVLLALVSCLQVWAFIQSERAFLFVLTPKFDGGFAPHKPLVLLADIKNSGRSTGFINDFNVTLKVVASNDKLPREPKYKKGAATAPGQ